MTLIAAAIMAAAPRTFRRLRGLTGLPLRGPMPVADADLSRIDISALAKEVISVYAANLRLVRVLAARIWFPAEYFSGNR